MKILVTGAGSLVGHGILRSLRLIEKRDFQIFTADPDFRSAGHWLGHHAVSIPLAKDESYLGALKEVVNKFKIDIVFIGTDPELMKVSRAREGLKTTVVISDPRVICIAEDKWDTVNFLKEHGFPYPASALSEDREGVKRLLDTVGFPLFAKPRTGARSAGVQKIDDDRSLQEVLKESHFIIQEYLPAETGEFTAGTMTYEQKCYSHIIFKRDLKDGNTYRAYQYEDQAHERTIVSVAEQMKGVYGPLNFQYRIRNGEPVIFEINSRFSGTTPLRAAVGINEVAIALEYFEHGKVTPPKTTQSGMAILRTWSDMIVPLDQLEAFRQHGELKNPTGKYFPFYEP